MDRSNRLAVAAVPAEAAIPVKPRKTVKTVEARSGETRERILEAAHHCLARDGYERITTRRIADAAGVNIATLHYYFGSKESLLSEATRYAYRQTQQALREIIDAAPDPVTALTVALEETWQTAREYRGVLRYDLAVRGFRDDTARREVILIYAAYRQLVEEILRQHLSRGGSLRPGVTVEMLAGHIVAVVDGVVLHYAISGDEGAARLSLTLIREHALNLMEVSGAGNEPKPE